MVRALASHHCGPGSIPGPGATCGLSLLLVLVPAPRVFLRVLRFSSLHKNQHSKFQFDPETVDEEPPRGNATANSVIIIIIIIIIGNLASPVPSECRVFQKFVDTFFIQINDSSLRIQC